MYKRVCLWVRIPLFQSLTSNMAEAENYVPEVELSVQIPECSQRAPSFSAKGEEGPHILTFNVLSLKYDVPKR